MTTRNERRPLAVPSHLRRGALKADEDASVQSGVQLLQLICHRIGRETLRDVSVLDVGCGTKVTQAILNHDVPIGSYTGVDVYRAMIEYLQDNVGDPRFAFHHVNFHNEMYNPSGEKLTRSSRLPVGDRRFDVICLFSVFTHLGPEDFNAMLCMLRKYVRPQGHLLFTLFIRPEQEEGFRDAFPGKPLLWAHYNERFARTLIQDTGWEAIALFSPTPEAQHQFLCCPA